MSRSRIHKSARSVLPILLALTLFAFSPQTLTPSRDGNTIALVAPSFVASAQEAPAAPMGFPVDEAGVAAYFKASTAVNLTSVRTVFRVIEAETADYLIGSVLVPSYPESYDVHLYVHRTGWFMAYYLAAEPSAKIVDWLSYNQSPIAPGTTVPTVLEKVLRLASISAGVAFPNATYYDFRYPNSTHLMLIAEDAWNGNELQLNLPLSYAYYETSWSFYANNCWDPSAYLDGVRLGYVHVCGWAFASGSIPPAQMLPATYHTFNIKADNGGYGGLSITYRVQ